MADANDPALRLALFEAWGMKCIWCKRPITYREMEVEHLIPKSLTGAELDDALRQHGLSEGYDLLATTNLAASCGACNGEKGARVPPDAPIVAVHLERATKLAPAIEKRAAKFTAKRELEKALAVIMATASSGNLDDSVAEQLMEAIGIVGAELPSPDDDEPVEVRLHPAASYLWDPERWSIQREVGPEVLFVSDGKTGGYVGTHHSFACSNCGSHGPWNGIICQTCGNREEPD